MCLPYYFCGIILRKCLLNKEFLTIRCHQRKSPKTVYDIGAKLKLVFGSPTSPDLLDNRLLIKLSASIPSAFGSMSLHPTTRWCIEMLEKYLSVDKILDVGVGAGILTLSILRLIINDKKISNFQIDAFDIYQDAVKQAQINLRLNGLETYVNLRQGVLSDYPENFYSLVIANLPPIAISSLWLELTNKVAINGKLILSGILRHNFKDMVEKLSSKGFKLVDQVVTDFWCLIVVENKKK